ncbi:MAG: histidinol dehydrogenase, partial [Gemmatimonadetes bacterium]|nr:histidinol dehydrogenase [Gemmatimonadota bacterium]NIR80383.1 histidinol dehydrogenase [Gemmatimonadota bacterium]NIT89145.1 histidinol dehydrogenase [Gemmatimonadota bacterium]NIU32943.1 histidinol dehydrogenase [Gemmatimonadota bacterium]NIU37339.1 histidinol dehydrogenase [Gemmatimonadota bacterium]
MKIAVEAPIGALSAAQRELLLDRRPEDEAELRARVREIVEAVIVRGDDALLEMVRRYDGVELTSLDVPRERWDEAMEALDADVRSALEQAATNIEAFHRAQRPEPLEVEVAPGVRVGRRSVALARAGVYAPGGRASYPSSVLMGVV